MIRYEDTVPGRFLRRQNRFTAQVLIGDREEKVHVKNTGRLQELLLPEASVMLQRAKDPGRKTAYDLISVWKAGLGWVNIDSLVPNKLMKEYLLGLGYDLVKAEHSYGDSRFDFYMERQGKRYLTEVKGCTLAADLSQGTGLFPDAPTERGVRHLEELARAAGEGYACQIAFVIQMNGIGRVLPNDQTQPAFRQALEKAAKAGVRVLCYRCRVEADSIEITDFVEDTERYRQGRQAMQSQP